MKPTVPKERTNKRHALGSRPVRRVVRIGLEVSVILALVAGGVACGRSEPGTSLEKQAASMPPKGEAHRAAGHDLGWRIDKSAEWDWVSKEGVREGRSQRAH